MITFNTFKIRLVIICFSILSCCFTAKAQYASVDSLKGFLCYKFGDTTLPKDAEIRDTKSNGKFIVYHSDTTNFCGLLSEAVTLSYYEGKLYQIFLDFGGEKESMSLLNSFTKTFGPYDKLEMVSNEYDIRTYCWSGKKVEIRYSTDATYTGSKVIIYDKVVKDRMYNLFYKNEPLTKEEKKLMDKMLEK